jgi:glutamate/tyrosine decarboxylase-like PLP-dependent enzyme
MTVWTQLIDEIEGFTTGVRDLPVLRQVTPAEVRTELESHYTFEKPIPLETLTADVIRLLRAWTTHATHPRYFGLFNPSVRPACIVADALVALYNPQLAVWSHAPAANEIERLTLRAFTEALGFAPEDVLANFTTGGAEANLSAVLAALAHHFPGFAESGAAGLKSRPAIYLTSESHHSFVKIARMTGLGTDALHEVSVTGHFTLDVDALARRIQADLEEGRSPLMVVGTAGTTGAGLIDPLPRIADTASRFGLWFHVDAAWGGSAALSPRLRPAVRGIERADSVTWDAHKWLSVPMGAGMFFCRHPEAVKRAFAISTSYMPRETGDQTVDQYAATAQWSRRLIGLKVFMALAELGMDGYGELIEHQAALGDLLRIRLREAGWLIRNETPLPVVCFSHPDIQSGGLTTGKILETIYARGRVWISDVILGGQERVLRACITSFRSNESDIECLIEELERARCLTENAC